ncbi:hypothetical protein BHE74_00021159 [Ensete ventricosum]|nr:hypothetical protein BHE74_00021159 [Ensete ventricosum]
MLLVRWKPILHCPPGEHPRRGLAWPLGPRRSLLLRRPIRSPAPAFLTISSSKFSQAGRARVRPIVRAGLAQTPSLADVENTEILFSETLPLMRSQTVKDTDDEDGNAVKQKRRIAPIYKEFPILKEEFVPNHMTVSVRRSDKTDKNIVQFDTDLPGDVVIHWGICKDDGRKWVIPSTPHPPATKIFRHKALQTLLQVK